MKIKSNSVIACGILMLVASGCQHQASSSTHPVKVKTMKVELSTMTGGPEFSGTVEESSGSALSFPVAGTVERICVTEGQRVGKGALIAVLDKVSLQSAYEAASATLEQATDAYDRLKQLHDNNSLPEIQWVEVQSKLKQAQSTERIARKNLEDGKLYAPFSGVISEKNVEMGQNVMPGQPVVKLVNVHPVKVAIAVPENEIAQLSIGQSVRVTVPALGGRTFEGKIAEKGIAANPISRTYEVKATVSNPEDELMPGMIGTLGLQAHEDAQVIILPAQLVQTDEQNNPFVWTNQQGKAHKQKITTGQLTRNGVVVTGGLKPGDEIITEGQQKVSNETPVTVE
jgi:RND family efflux transporter MFP subunit